VYAPQLAAQRWGNGSQHRCFLQRRLGKRARTDTPRTPPASAARPPGASARVLAVRRGRGPLLCTSVGDILSRPSFLEGKRFQRPGRRGKTTGYAPADRRPAPHNAMPRSPRGRGRVSGAARWVAAARRRPEVPWPGQPAAATQRNPSAFPPARSASRRGH